jgi:DNA-binding transcriptional LysR family regulator
MGASQTHAVISLVNHGLGFAIVPRSARALQMENIVFRDIELPDQFRSDMYLVSKSPENSVLRSRVKDLIVNALAPFRVSAPQN